MTTENDQAAAVPSLPMLTQPAKLAALITTFRDSLDPISDQDHYRLTEIYAERLFAAAAPPPTFERVTGAGVDADATRRLLSEFTQRERGH